MSETFSNDQYLTLRREIGRESTASERARERGEFRRQPHLDVTSIEVSTHTPATPAVRRDDRPRQESGKRGRFVH
jgi:hypothetical protein